MNKIIFVMKISQVFSLILFIEKKKVLNQFNLLLFLYFLFGKIESINHIGSIIFCQHI